MSTPQEERMRVDKWLWCVRLYKSRSIASDACRDGHIRIHDKPVKPSHLVQAGDRLLVKKDGYNLQYEITGLLKSRAGAPIAQQCYINHTPEEELHKYDEWYVGKARAEFRERGSGRPTKRERREIDRFKDI